MTFSSAVIWPNRRMFWKVRAMPRLTTRWGFTTGNSDAVERTALIRYVGAGEHVEEVVVCRVPAGTDQAIYPPLGDGQRDFRTRR